MVTVWLKTASWKMFPCKQQQGGGRGEHAAVSEPSVRSPGAAWSPEWAYSGVLVVEVDDQAEGAPPHGLCGNEGVLEGGLAARRHLGPQLQRREVLDVELVVLHERKRATSTLSPPYIAGGQEVTGQYLRVAERGVQRFYHKAVRALVGEAQQELDNVVGREVCRETTGSEQDHSIIMRSLQTHNYG